MTSKVHHTYKRNNNSGWSQNDRDFRRDSRRVTFKQSGRHGKHQKDWGTAIREHLQEEDVDMAVGSSKGYVNRKLNSKKGRRGSPAPIIKRKLLEGPSNWYRVSIPHGDKYEKSYLLKLILDNVAPLPFWPIAWQTFGTTCVFYVEDYKLAEKIFALDRQLQMPNGFKLIVKVHPGTPNIDMSSEVKEKIKLVMANRYNAATKALDLSKFHADPALQDTFCALFKPIVFLTVIEIIGDNIPELEALNLFDNKLGSLGIAKKLVKKAPNLKILHMGNNRLRDVTILDPLIGLPVVDLLLDGNPLCDKFQDQDAYISEVRKRFPKCTKLDGIDLPPPISFDILEETHLPERVQTFLCAPEGGNIVRQFLEQYFAIFDTENRQPLLQAYHESAVFSLTMAYPYGYGRDKNVAWLNWYNTDNRNLYRLTDIDRRNKLLKQGQLAVVSFLQDMPQTKHDIHSFTVDLTVFTPQMLILTITGMFKEIKSGHKIPPIRYFFRTLVIVPAGSGFCIANETLHITNALPDQAKEAFKGPIVEVQPSTSAVSSPVVQQVAPPVVLDDGTKQEMVKQLSIKSGMNLEWSVKCLEETQWDFNRACMVFEDLNQKGGVPPEAFVK